MTRKLKVDETWRRERCRCGHDRGDHAPTMHGPFIVDRGRGACLVFGCPCAACRVPAEGQP